MPLSDFIVSTTILPGGPLVEKAEIVRQLLAKLAADGHIQPNDIPALLAAVMRRESLASTGIGQGVAVPHAMHAAVTRPLAILGLCREAVNFESIDAEPTDIFTLVLAPRDGPERDRRAAANRSGRLLKMLADEAFRARVRQVQTAEEMFTVLRVVGE